MALSTTRTLLTQTGINTHQVLNVGGLDSAGIATFLNFKTGTTNVHNVGVELAGINVLGADTPIGTGATIYDDGGARFSGIVSATSFVGDITGGGTFTGDISDATGAPAGLGTALSQTQTLALNKVYYTDKVLSISTTTTVDPPTSASAAYTQYTDIKIEDGHDLIIKDGDELRPDVLGLSTTKTLDTNNFPDGLRGNLIGNVTGDATGLSGNPSINTTGIITATAFIPSHGQLSHRNKVDNGSFLINQRGGPFTSTGSEYIMDRFEHVSSASLTFDTTTTHDSSGPVGFRKCLKITPDSTQTPTGGMNGMIQHKIEGQDLQDLCFGTSSAKKITISFYAKSANSNNNHQYTLQIRKYDDSNNRNMLNRAFTVTSSWQRFTMTFDGDTAENIRNDNGVGMQILWHLSTGPDDIHAQVNTFSRTTNSSFYTAVTGQSNFMDNTNNEFYLTGVQLEIGSVATPFEYRSIGEELARCQRYFYKWVSSQAYSNMCIAYAGSSTQVETVFNLPVVMRASPTFAYSGQFRFVGYTPQNAKNLSNLVVHRSHPLTPYLRGTVSGSASGLVGELGDSGSNDAAALFSAEF